MSASTTTAAVVSDRIYRKYRYLEQEYEKFVIKEVSGTNVVSEIGWRGGCQQEISWHQNSAAIFLYAFQNDQNRLVIFSVALGENYKSITSQLQDKTKVFKLRVYQLKDTDGSVYNALSPFNEKQAESFQQSITLAPVLPSNTITSKSVIVIGSDTAGKSFVANLLLGSEEFVVNHSSVSSSTDECLFHSKIYKGDELRVTDCNQVDSCTRTELDAMKLEIMTLNPDGFDAIFLVFGNRLDEKTMFLYNLITRLWFPESDNHVFLIRNKFSSANDMTKCDADWHAMCAHGNFLSEFMTHLTRRQLLHLNYVADFADDNSNDNTLKLRRAIESKDYGVYCPEWYVSALECFDARDSTNQQLEIMQQQTTHILKLLENVDFAGMNFSKFKHLLSQYGK